MDIFNKNNSVLGNFFFKREAKYKYLLSYCNNFHTFLDISWVNRVLVGLGYQILNRNIVFEYFVQTMNNCNKVGTKKYLISDIQFSSTVFFILLFHQDFCSRLLTQFSILYLLR